MKMFRRHLLFSGALITAIGCSGDPTGPRESPDGRLELDEATLVDFAVGDTSAWLTLETEQDSFYVLEVAPKDGGIYVTPFDSVNGSQIGPYAQVTEASPAVLRVTHVVGGGAHGGITYRIDPSPFGAAARAVVTARRVPAGPEHISGVIALDAAITGESLDAPGDVDLFTFTGTSGQIIEPMIHIPGPEGVTLAICANISTPNGAVLGAVSAFPGDTVLTDFQGGRLTLPTTGIYQIRVNSGRNGCFGWGGNGPYVGAYTFDIALIDLAPETASADLAPGDTVTTEGIDRIGDIDLFTVHGTPGTQVNLFLRGIGVMMRLEVPGLPMLVSLVADTSLLDTPSGRRTLPDSGKVTVKVTGYYDGPGGTTGLYQLAVYAIDPAPEVRPAAIALDDTVTGEAIGFPGDIDRFTFAGTAGQFVNVHLSAVGALPNGSLALQLFAPNGSSMGAAIGSIVTDQDSVDRATGRRELPVTGTYTVEVRGSDDRHREDIGVYRVIPRLINTAPELRPAFLAPGDSVVGESLDEWGDVDEFFVTIADSTVFAVVVDFGAPGVFGSVRMTLTDTATADTLGTLVVASQTLDATPGIILPPGTYRIRMEGVLDEEWSIRGSYKVRTIATLAP